MSETDEELLAGKLRERFREPFVRLTEPWEQCAWSKSYRAEFDSREALYVKGTPRGRAKARITSFLHHCRPDHIPTVFVDDLLPEHEWRWFLLEDAGECSHNAITPERAIHAAFCLGRLQSITSRHTELAPFLPQCRADSLQEALTSVCDWALRSAPGEIRTELLSFRDGVSRSTLYFRALQEKLARLPPACIHGDFWSGNIAFRNGKTRLIDWGDALWGAGSVSIVNLLFSAGDGLSGSADEVWGAYARGWERTLTEEFIQASQAAWEVSLLVVDVEIAKCCNGTVEMLPGLIPGIRALATLWE